MSQTTASPTTSLRSQKPAQATFRPHPFFRGGHLQTLATTFYATPVYHWQSSTRLVTLPDGDQLAVQDDQPPEWTPDSPRLILVHGLCGDHTAGYMVRIANRFFQRGVRVFRVDMRGCGAGFELAAGLNHASRSDDIFQVVRRVHELSGPGPIWLAGISLGGSQLLKMLGEFGSRTMLTEPAWSHIERAAAVSPPVDLAGCARKMQRLHMRLYNRYFIHHLLKRIPPRLAARADFQQLDLRRRPRTMYELDDRITAPLSGYAGADEYYASSTSEQYATANQIPTLVLAAVDDPIVPARGFHRVDWPHATQLEIATGGGHVAFLSRGAERYWLDHRLERWFFG